MDYYVNIDLETLNEPWRSFPYEFHVGRDVYRSKEVRDWLNENVEWESVDDKILLFSCEEDAMAFKLRWT